jgi:hypothetical protein
VIIEGEFYWLRFIEGQEWIIGQATVYAHDDVSFYLCGADYGIEASVFEIGDKIPLYRSTDK